MKPRRFVCWKIGRFDQIDDFFAFRFEKNLIRFDSFSKEIQWICPWNENVFAGRVNKQMM